MSAASAGVLLGSYPAGHADFDVAETLFCEMRFERGERFGRGHVRNEAQVRAWPRLFREEIVFPPGPV